MDISPPYPPSPGGGGGGGRSRSMSCSGLVSGSRSGHTSGNGVVTSVGGWCQKMGLCGRGVYGENGDVVRKERSRDGFSGSLLGSFISF